jgi:uncharacterized protein YndB with AHSA1/START domain
MTTTSTSTTTQVHRVYIKATPQAVWDAITSPEWTVRYGYGGRGEYELRPGGAYRGTSSEGMRAAGAPEVAVDGEILEVDAPHRLVQTWRMLMDPDMAAQGFTRVTYELDEIERNDARFTRLTVTHDLTNAPALAPLMSGGLEAQGAGGGWAWVLSDLKTLVETGSSIGNAY